MSPDTPRYPGLMEFAAWYSGIHGYAATTVCAFGVVANLANIVVLTRRSMITSTNVILTWLAVADLLTMACFLPFGGHFYIARGYIPEVSFPATQSVDWIRYFVFYINFSVVCHTVAVWLTIALAIFRYLCICFPTRATTLCSLYRAKAAVLTVYIASVVICLPNYMVIDIVLLTHLGNPTNQSMTSSSINIIEGVNATVAAMQTPPSGNFSYYTVKDKEEAILSTFNYWIQAVFIKLVPCFLLTVLTILLVVAMHEANVRRTKLKSQGRRDESDRAREHNRTTAMLLAVVGLFQLVELPHGVLTLCSIFVSNFHVDVYWALGDVIDIMALLNNTINFFLYCTMSRLFRDQFVQTFFRCAPSSSSPPTAMRVSVRRANAADAASPSRKNTAGWTKLETVTTVQVDKAAVDDNHGNGFNR